MKESNKFRAWIKLRYMQLLLAATAVVLILTLSYCHSRTNTELAAKLDADTKTSDNAQSTTDVDGDGLQDNFDTCPDEAGAALDNGCPVDSDGDGVTDLDDACPTRAGIINGCPEDSDGDGITNSEDNCPDDAGSVANQGCPTDSDGDGIGDAIDQCPQTAGLGSPDGCAPVSGPGHESIIADKSTYNSSDTASATSGANQEIPDTDGDGLTGEFDQCPEQFGGAEDNGCPPDSDNDGIADIDDHCPAVAGTAHAHGCVNNAAASDGFVLDNQDRQILDDALAGVAFDSGSDTLTTASRDLLTNVAGLLRKYPTAVLEIRGHTDASGVADNNMQLSMARARSAAAYIVSTGIDVNRIHAFGFGESQPIADNSSKAGRQINRRVEFELLFNE